MSRELKKKVIGDAEYQCTMFPPMRSLKVFTKLIKYIGEPLAVMMKSNIGGKAILDMDVAEIDFEGAIRAAGNSLGENDLYHLFKEICSATIVTTSDGKMQHLKGDAFDTHFTGPKALKEMFLVVVFALEVNYGDFLGGAAAESESLPADVVANPTSISAI